MKKAVSYIGYILLIASFAALVTLFALASKNEKILAGTVASSFAAASESEPSPDGNAEATGAVRVKTFKVTSSGYIRMIPGGSFKISVSTEPANANERLVWHSFDPSTCTVGTDGVVKALKQGFGTIEVSTADGENPLRIMVDVLNKPDTIIDAPYITQIYEWPNGCEAVSTVMALNYAGIDIGVDEFIDNYLDMSPLPEIRDDGELWGYSPWEYFLGDPRDYDGLCCYAPAITKALDKFVDTEKYEVIELHGASLDELCRDYVMQGDPVIVWATMYMNYPYEPGWEWNVIDGGEGETFSWVAPIHCLLLVGFDSDYYYFNDPTAGEKVAYPKWDSEVAYEGLYEQAIVVRQKKS